MLLRAPVQVTAVQCNICCASDVAALAAAIAAAGAGPVRAVMHVGGTLQDATLPAQTAKSLRIVYAPKVQVCFHCTSSMHRFVHSAWPIRCELDFCTVLRVSSSPETPILAWIPAANLTPVHNNC